MSFQKGDLVKTRSGAVMEVTHCNQPNIKGVSDVTLKGGEWNCRQPDDTLTLVKRADSTAMDEVR